MTTAKAAAIATAKATAQTAAATERVVGNYRLAERLGEGGMGEVYRAVDTMLEREVALKTLRPEMAAREEIVERFRVEAIALARLHHRHIAAVYAFFQHGGQHHIAMQYVRGQTLEAVLQHRGKLPWREAAALTSDVLQALDHAHTLGVVHRDLKPANLMIDSQGRTVVMDFGIARVLARSRQTRAGTLVGTLEYIAPEVVRGDDVDARSDLYSLGCVLYEMVTGELPFQATSDFELMRAHAEQAAPRPSVRAGALPAALEAVILRAMAKQPQQRYASAREFLDALTAAGATAEDAAVRDDAQTRIQRAVHGWTRHLEPARVALRRACRWLALPELADRAAWRGWLQANPGLTSVAVVAAGALALSMGLAVRQVCCNAPGPTPPLRVGTSPAWPPAVSGVVAAGEPAFLQGSSPAPSASPSPSPSVAPYPSPSPSPSPWQSPSPAAPVDTRESRESRESRTGRPSDRFVLSDGEAPVQRQRSTPEPGRTESAKPPPAPRQPQGWYVNR